MIAQPKCLAKKTNTIPVCVQEWETVKVLAVLLLYKGVGNGLHAVLRTDEDNSSSSTHNQAKLPGVLRQFILIIRVYTYTKKATVKTQTLYFHQPAYYICHKFKEFILFEKQFCFCGILKAINVYEFVFANRGMLSKSLDAEKYLPRMYSIVPSNTRFSRGSNPFRTPLAIQ